MAVCCVVHHSSRAVSIRGADADQGCKIVTEVLDEVARCQHSRSCAGYISHCPYLCTVRVDCLCLQEPKQSIWHLAHTGLLPLFHVDCSSASFYKCHTFAGSNFDTMDAQWAFFAGKQAMKM